MKKTIFLDKKIQVLIVSAGGVGTTFLMREIEKYKTTNCSSNTDGYKHLPIPPISFNQNLKVIYIFGNPILASMSLFRRQYHHTQSIKVQEYLRADYTIPFSMSIEEYAKGAKDGFYFKLHFYHWYKQYPIYNTLFLKYETLSEQVEVIRDFLDLPLHFVHNFPPKIKRNSNFSNLSATTLGGLVQLYGSFEKEIQQLPSSMTQKGNYIILLKNIFTRPYLQGLKKVLWRKVPLLRRVRNRLYKILLSEK